MKKILMTSFVFGLVAIMSCGESKPKELTLAELNAQEEKESASLAVNNIGIGPVKSIELTEAVNSEMAKNGEVIFSDKCVACHRMESKLIGPALEGITERRNPAWIMNMILNPEQMIKEDPIAMELMEEYKTPMLNQNLTEDESRAILEYFRAI
ncbi:MAG: cytochrome c [Flavobacteriales bacterium]